MKAARAAASGAKRKGNSVADSTTAFPMAGVGHWRRCVAFSLAKTRSTSLTPTMPIVCNHLPSNMSVLLTHVLELCLDPNYFQLNITIFIQHGRKNLDSGDDTVHSP